MTSKWTISLRKEFTVESTRDDVFSFLINPKNTSQWLPGFSYVSHRPKGEVSVGSQVLCRVRAFGFTKNATFEFVAIDSPNFFRSEVTLRRGPSDFGYDPMISPTLCPISFTALKSKFSLPLMAFVVGNGRMRTSSGSSKKALSATGK